MIKNQNIILQVLIIAVLAAIISSCSTVNQDSPLSFVDASGNHPDGWIEAHGSYAGNDGALCMDCHGDDLAGGITGVSCSTDAVGCHAGGPAFHPADWLDSSLTGNDWHGDAYDNGFQVNGLDCVDCHEPPDLDDPVDGKCIICHFTLSGGRTPGGWAHADTGTAHASYAGSTEESVCVACHEINISFGNQPFCHNCHGAGGTHPEPDWAERAQHGVAAKRDPGTMAGFETCATCHGADFDGGSAGVSCLSQAACHGSGVNAPHPEDSRWRSESTPTHTSTDRDNAPACALCHQKNSGTPGCFNNTLCHGNED